VEQAREAVAMIECPECRKVYQPEHPDQICCSRHCARIRDARRGEPSLEDKKARFTDAILKKFDEIFRLK
jgi:hypothetical protein